MDGRNVRQQSQNHTQGRRASQDPEHSSHLLTVIALAIQSFPNN
jgi:hypothetical protein